MIKIGIVGSGFGGIVHAPAFHAHEAFELVAIASPNRAEAVAKERNIPNAFPSLEAMLDGIELDAVSISSPPFAHHDAVLLALSRGKHVLCEKPLARTVAEAEEMVVAANTSGKATGIGFEFRFDASRQALKELVTNNHVGPLREIEFTHLTTMLRRDGDRKRGWWFEYARGGGIIQAVGSHMIDSVTWLAGRPPRSYTGFSRTANTTRTDDRGTFTSDVADGMFVLLDYGDGLVGRITLDATNVVNSSTLAVYGEDRTAAASSDGLAWAKLFTVDAKETSEYELASSPYDHYKAAQPNVPLVLKMLDQFVAKIEGKPNTLPTFEDGLLVQRVMAAVGYEK
ncbi:MAG TPA: Gfo/Idh/MocA family oxidoreductase [Candidatus Acidoferrales bacterium]|nr:Gfo/Idh/MocA family oxidoreductase [Candidatus Acidoferrales bacterium]